MPAPLPEQTMSASDAIEMSRAKYVEMARAEERGGRELPAVALSRSELGDYARTQVECTTELLREARRSSFSVSISLAEVLERAAARREARLRESVPEDRR